MSNEKKHWSFTVSLTLIFLITLSQLSSVSGNEDRRYSDIFAAIEANNLRAVTDFVRKNPTLVNAENNTGATPLRYAAWKGNLYIVAFLISEGADVNAKDKKNQGFTPLHMATIKDHRDVAELLISKGADVNKKEDNGGTPLHYAAMNGYRDIAELLISKGAYVNAKSKLGLTPMYYAVWKGHKEIIDLLKRHGGKE